jgi:hypothetical protein
VVAIRWDASSKRYSARLCNRMTCRSNLPLEPAALDSPASGGIDISCSNLTIQHCSNFLVAVQHMLPPNFQLTYRLDRSHVDQATGSVAGITNT